MPVRANLRKGEDGRTYGRLGICPNQRILCTQHETPARPIPQRAARSTAQVKARAHGRPSRTITPQNESRCAHANQSADHAACRRRTPRAQIKPCCDQQARARTRSRRAPSSVQSCLPPIGLPMPQQDAGRRANCRYASVTGRPALEIFAERQTP